MLKPIYKGKMKAACAACAATRLYSISLINSPCGFTYVGLAT